MSVQRPGGTTPLDRFAQQSDSGLTCPRCGYVDENGRWRAATSGDRVRYEHQCPSCGSVATRTLRLK
jgi:DNA-directed RNA polymerase subunit RPC12/RpoP